MLPRNRRRAAATVSYSPSTSPSPASVSSAVVCEPLAPAVWIFSVPIPNSRSSGPRVVSMFVTVRYGTCFTDFVITPARTITSSS